MFGGDFVCKNLGHKPNYKHMSNTFFNTDHFLVGGSNHSIIYSTDFLLSLVLVAHAREYVGWVYEQELDCAALLPDRHQYNMAALVSGIFLASLRRTWRRK